jgi:hypothetical protein
MKKARDRRALPFSKTRTWSALWSCGLATAHSGCSPAVTCALRVTASPPSAKGWTARGPHNVCGQGAESFSVKSLRETVAASIDGVTRFSAKVDGEPVEEICRVRSKVYAVALPEKNAFDKLGAPHARPGFMRRPSMRAITYGSSHWQSDNTACAFVRSTRTFSPVLKST